MDDVEKYLRSLLNQQGLTISDRLGQAFQQFVSNPENSTNVKSIRSLQEQMTKNWQLIARREEINTMQIAFPNGIAGKPYKAEFNLAHLGLEDLISYDLTGFEGSGLQYDPDTKMIQGQPEISGDIVLSLRYNFEAEPNDAEANYRKITIIINPDPKSLWKNIPSDPEDPFAKPDDTSELVSFLGNTLVVASKRGRSHANKGSFRDDHYAFAELDAHWGIIAVSDGAGSASKSRKGSQLACESVINFFHGKASEIIQLLDQTIENYQNDTSLKNKVLDIAYPYLSAAAHNAYDTIAGFSTTANAQLNEFHCTLSFVLIKRFPDGCAFFSFGVGDCPVVIADKKMNWVKPLNSLDVGEYGGGTRFITMPEIFSNANFESRFGFEFTIDFPYVVLMTDGIYDPKFEVEANLVKIAHWNTFFSDLAGNNSENTVVSLDSTNKSLNGQLSAWMDFWSPGNHDDRTLLLLF